MSQAHPQDLTPEELAAVEALVGAAGDYVTPSDDLRPRVLESVRARQRVGRRASRTTLSAAAALAATLAASWQITATGQAIQQASERRQIAEILADESSTARGGVWALVDAFFAVRQRRAEALGTAPDPGRSESAENEKKATQNDPDADS